MAALEQELEQKERDLAERREGDGRAAEQQVKRATRLSAPGLARRATRHLKYSICGRATRLDIGSGEMCYATFDIVTGETCYATFDIVSVDVLRDF